VFERPGIGDGEGSAVGFADGTAEWLPAADLDKQLKTRQSQRETVPPNGG
jgi:hypothetical protein